MLSASLRVLAPRMIEALNQNKSSHAFDGMSSFDFFVCQIDDCNSYILDFILRSDLEEDSVELETSLCDEQCRQQHQQQCVDVSWNSLGHVVAAVYSRTDYEDFWHHTSTVCTVGIECQFRVMKWHLQWNVNLKLNAHKAHRSIELKVQTFSFPKIIVQSCASCVKFHPNVASILAIGHLNGSVNYR